MSSIYSQIVIIGAGGFLGQALSAYSLKKSAELLCISRSFQWNPEQYNQQAKINLIKTNVEDVENYSHLIKEKSVIVYMAGSTNLNACQEKPADDLSHHVLALTSFLKSIRCINISKIIFISSGGAIYGEPINNTSRENDDCRPKSVYGLRNKILEDIICSLCAIYEKDFLILRVANPVGVAQLSLKRRGLVMSLFSSCFNNEIVRIRSSGMQYRDYIYSQDFSEFIFTIASNKKFRMPPILNICSGKSFNAHEVISLISMVTQKFPNVEFTEESYRGDVLHSCINNELLIKTLEGIDKPSLFLPLDKKISNICIDLRQTCSLT